MVGRRVSSHARWRAFRNRITGIARVLADRSPRRGEFPVHKKKDLRVELRAAADLALPALFWGKAGWRVSASWKIILISQGVKRKKSQPATTSSRCREVHIFLRRGDEGSARPFQHARTLHDVAIVPLAMASARWASPTPDNSLSQRPRRGCHSRRKHLMHSGF